MILPRQRHRGVEFRGFHRLGEDVFAFLFLVTVVSLLLAKEQIMTASGVQETPVRQIEKDSSNDVVQVKRDKVGRLIRDKDEGFLLQFDTSVYCSKKPKDMENLEESGLIQISRDQSGRETKRLYLWNDPDPSISLEEYLKNAPVFRDPHIQVFFARERDPS